VQLPFTRDQFLDVFAAYNATLWPGAVALWFASAVMAALLLASRRRPTDRLVSGLLAFHWAWSAVAYHIVFFTRINTAAWLFGALFLLQAGLFAWLGVVRGRLRFVPQQSGWRTSAWALVLYALVYPAINAVQHGTWLSIPTFGVPCPTTIFSAGLLILAVPRLWALATIPIIWSVVGGSAAFSLGVRADYALPIAGVMLAASLFQRTGHAPVIREHA
jgi:hypothetical protein